MCNRLTCVRPIRNGRRNQTKSIQLNSIKWWRVDRDLFRWPPLITCASSGSNIYSYSVAFWLIKSVATFVYGQLISGRVIWPACVTSSHVLLPPHFFFFTFSQTTLTNILLEWFHCNRDRRSFPRLCPRLWRPVDVALSWPVYVLQFTVVCRNAQRQRPCF